MSRSSYRAWRFHYPGIDAPLLNSGIRYTAQGTIEMVEHNGSVRQAILLLLSTRPGERVMRPGYGCDLYRLLFAPNDDTTAGLAIHYVRRALLWWEPRIRIIRLDAGFDPHQPEHLNISLEYQVRGNLQIELLDFSLNLNGEGS